MTPCTGQSNFRPCLTCARFRANAIMRPVVKLTTCAMYVEKPPVLGSIKPPKLISYAGAPK